MMMHKPLNSKDEKDFTCQENEEQGGLANIEDCVDSPTQGLEKYLKKKKSKKRLIKHLVTVTSP